jgi:hypothetical protein
MKRQFYDYPKKYERPFIPKFKGGDFVITNNLHWQEARNMFGKNAIFIKNPVKILRIFITEKDGFGECKYPISYELECKKASQVNEIFLEGIK